MPEKSDTTHTLLERELVIYRRENSTLWQCRFKVDGLWQCASTKQADLTLAKKAAYELRMEAEIRRRNNLPVITRKFRDVAKLAIQRMQAELTSGKGRVSYSDYMRVINEHLIPALGKRNIANIDYEALAELDEKRTAAMGKAPSHSTLLTHNAALNRVLDEAVLRNFLTDANRPKLESKGRSSARRPSFEMHEIRAVLNSFEEWIASGRNDESRELRALMRDYVEILVDTGARPGKELIDLKWKQVKFSMKPTLTATSAVDEEGEPITLANLNRSCEMIVTGKTGTRTIVGMQRTVKALERLATRNYGIDDGVSNPFAKLTVPSNNDYVLRRKDKSEATSFQKLFENYLEEHNLLVDPKTEQSRVFYSLRHTYATLALTHDRVPIHTLAKQMGTSVQMIEQHYSHLKVVQAIDQLRGEETRRLIDAGGVIDDAYVSRRKGSIKSG